jgi:hypothetical protein
LNPNQNQFNVLSELSPLFRPENRVARLGEFSPNGWLFTLSPKIVIKQWPQKFAALLLKKGP